MGNQRIEKLYRRKSGLTGLRRLQKVHVYPNGLGEPSVPVKPMSAAEVQEGRTYMKEFTWQGVTVRVGDKIVWKWHAKDGEERKPHVVKAIFTDANVDYHGYGYGSPHEEEPVWLDLDARDYHTYKAKDGVRYAHVKRPLKFNDYWIHVNAELEIIKKK